MKLKNRKGYTLIELMLVVVILGLLASLVSPHIDLVLVKAYQAKSRANLSSTRAALNIYYTEMEGTWPLVEYPAGDTHYTVHGLSLSTVLVPKYASGILTPELHDRNPTFNGLSGYYDDAAQTLMSMSPPKDVFIVHGAPAYIPLLNSPFAYDNQNGYFYISNGNYDTKGEFFYSW